MKVECVEIKNGPNAGQWTIHVDGEPSLYYCPTQHAAMRVYNRLMRSDKMTSRTLREKLDPNKPEEGEAELVVPKGNNPDPDDDCKVIVDGKTTECKRRELNTVADVCAFMSRGKLGRRNAMTKELQRVAGKKAELHCDDVEGFSGSCGDDRYVIFCDRKVGGDIRVKKVEED